MIDENEMDSRMTPESRNLVSAILQSMKPGDSINLDINLNGVMREANATRINQGLKFPNLIITEFTVTNPNDNFNRESKR